MIQVSSNGISSLFLFLDNLAARASALVNTQRGHYRAFCWPGSAFSAALRYAALFLDNLERFRSGETLINIVDFSAGY